VNNTNSQTLEDNLCALVRQELRLGDEQLGVTTKLRELPGVESIKILRIVAKIERAYNLELEDEVVFRVQTIGELATAIRELQTAEKSA
jgi:acyl carrier protein